MLILISSSCEIIIRSTPNNFRLLGIEKNRKEDFIISRKDLDSHVSMAVVRNIMLIISSKSRIKEAMTFDLEHNLRRYQ